jgi:hypothetical protein
LGKWVSTLQFGFFQMLSGIKAFEFTGKLRTEGRRIEPGNRCGSTHAIDNVGPEGFYRIPQRGKGTYTGNYYSFGHYFAVN